MSAVAPLPCGPAPDTASSLSLEEARAWIGRRLVLRKPRLHFEPGTRCVVMCVVDFGDGLLLSVTTDGARAEEVDQLTVNELTAFFEVAPRAIDTGATQEADPPHRVGYARGIVAGARRFGRGCAALARSLSRALEAKHAAERYFAMSDRQLAAHGLTRTDIPARLRAILDGD